MFVIFSAVCKYFNVHALILKIILSVLKNIVMSCCLFRFVQLTFWYGDEKYYKKSVGVENLNKAWKRNATILISCMQKHANCWRQVI